MFAQKELLYNNIYPTFNNNGELISLSYYKNKQYKTYEKELLSEGLANTSIDYLRKYINETKFNEKLALINKFNLVYLNKQSGTYYPINQIKDSKHFEIIDINFFKQFYNPPTKNANKYKKYKFKDLNLKTGDVNIYFTNPTLYSRPQKGCINDNCAVVVNLINNAKSSIKFAIYGFSGEPEILDAIKKAENRGVKIYGIVDMDIKGHNVYPETQTLIANIKKEPAP